MQCTEHSSHTLAARHRHQILMYTACMNVACRLVVSNMNFSWPLALLVLFFLIRLPSVVSSWSLAMCLMQEQQAGPAHQGDGNDANGQATTSTATVPAAAIRHKQQKSLQRKRKHDKVDHQRWANPIRVIDLKHLLQSGFQEATSSDSGHHPKRARFTESPGQGSAEQHPGTRSNHPKHVTQPLQSLSTGTATSGLEEGEIPPAQAAAAYAAGQLSNATADGAGSKAGPSAGQLSDAAADGAGSKAGPSAGQLSNTAADGAGSKAGPSAGQLSDAAADGAGSTERPLPGAADATASTAGHTSDMGNQTGAHGDGSVMDLMEQRGASSAGRVAELPQEPGAAVGVDSTADVQQQPSGVYAADGTARHAAMGEPAVDNDGLGVDPDQVMASNTSPFHHGSIDSAGSADAAAKVGLAWMEGSAEEYDEGEDDGVDVMDEGADDGVGDDDAFGDDEEDHHEEEVDKVLKSLSVLDPDKLLEVQEVGTRLHEHACLMQPDALLLGKCLRRN